MKIDEIVGKYITEAKQTTAERIKQLEFDIESSKKGKVDFSKSQIAAMQKEIKHLKTLKK